LEVTKVGETMGAAAVKFPLRSLETCLGDLCAAAILGPFTIRKLGKI
jgi:hypothetical protein